MPTKSAKIKTAKKSEVLTIASKKPKVLVKKAKTTAPSKTVIKPKTKEAVKGKKGSPLPDRLKKKTIVKEPQVKEKPICTVVEKSMLTPHSMPVIEAKPQVEIKPPQQKVEVKLSIPPEKLKGIPQGKKEELKKEVAPEPVIIAKGEPGIAVIAPSPEQVFPEAQKVIEVNFPISLKDLALYFKEKPVALIKKLLDHKIIANLNLAINEELAKKIAFEYGYELKRKPTEEELLFKEHEVRDISKLKPRPPIVTFMGHVDHGKTSLLDAIRKSKLADSEHGGITQHIGAYSVILPKGKITFLDTPGHEAFTAMRARGAQVTDIVVLVVAADDGIMPQTVEALDHAKDAKATIVVAINKIDKPQANIDRIKKQLAELGFNPEDWGGKTITVGVSAKTGQGIDQLLEMILLEAEMLEVSADPTALASGVVLEAKISEGRGTVATLLVENGTLKPQNAVIIGPYYAKVRAMFNEYGKHIAEAGPATPVEILGLSGLPEAGEKFFVLSDEKKAKELAQKRRQELRERELRPVRMMSLEEFSNQIKEGKIKELKLILKADVGGSLEAINETLKKLATSEVRLNLIHQGIGSINVSDVILAEASGAIILGFHVDTDERSKEEANKAGIDIRTYNVIYELVNDIKTALEGLLEPKLKKNFLGRVVVRQMFKLSRSGIIAGAYVEKGKITRSAKVSLLRNGGLIYEGAIQSLKRFKDDVREVTEGMECGVSLANFTDIMAGDIIEAYDIEKIARKL